AAFESPPLIRSKDHVNCDVLEETSLRIAPSHWTKRLSTLRCQVLEEKQAGFSGDDYVLITIPINIHYSDLHPSAGARAVVQNMPLPLYGAIRHDSLVPVDSERLIGAGIMVMRIVAFAGDHFASSVAIQIHQGQRMRLR